MATYTLRTRVNRTLEYGGKLYADGDSITLPKSEAERIALDYPGYRFEEKGGGQISVASIDASTAPPAGPPRATATP